MRATRNYYREAIQLEIRPESFVESKVPEEVDEVADRWPLSHFPFCQLCGHCVDSFWHGSPGRFCFLLKRSPIVGGSQIGDWSAPPSHRHVPPSSQMSLLPVGGAGIAAAEISSGSWERIQLWPPNCCLCWRRGRLMPANDQADTLGAIAHVPDSVFVSLMTTWLHAITLKAIQSANVANWLIQSQTEVERLNQMELDSNWRHCKVMNLLERLIRPE